MITRWCLGLKSECTNLTTCLKLLTKLIKDNTMENQEETSTNELDVTENKSKSSNIILQISEAERSRIRAVCGSQLIKLAQENFFKPLITAEYFHVLAKLIIVDNFF